VSTEKSLAVVIRQADFSESSRVLTLFTRDFGKVSLVAKGAKRLKGPFEAALDLLCVCNIVFIRKSSAALDILTEAQLVKRFKSRERDLRSLYAGYYVAELLDGLSEEYDPHPPWFDETLAALDAFSGEGDLDLALLRYELVSLREIGQLPTLDACVVCGAPAAGQASFAYWVSQGGLICERCQTVENQANRVQAGTVSILRRLVEATDGSWKRLAVSKVQLSEMRRLATAAVSHVLGRRPRMLAYLHTR
jgi:DNA repair protein RecO (recombination protein O)